VAVHKTVKHLALQGAVTGSSTPFRPGGFQVLQRIQVLELKIKSWLLSLAILIIAFAGGALFVFKVPVLQVVNTNRPGALILWLGESGRFSIFYVNSIYLQAASEEFEAGEGEEILLRGVRTRSPSVAQYYGFDGDNRNYYPVNRRMKSFVLRLGMSQAQTLSHGGKKIPLEDLGERGDRLEVRVLRMTWGKYLLSRWVEEKS
jgi:hypothetical protein